MNISKLLVIPALFAASFASAEMVRVGVQFAQDADNNFDKVLDVADGQLEVSYNQDETRKVEITRTGAVYAVEVSVKNEAGDWEVIGSQELDLSNNEGGAVQLAELVSATIMKGAE